MEGCKKSRNILNIGEEEDVRKRKNNMALVLGVQKQYSRYSEEVLVIVTTSAIAATCPTVVKATIAVTCHNVVAVATVPTTNRLL